MPDIIEPATINKYKNLGCSCGCGQHCGNSCMTDDCDCNECRCSKCMKDVYKTNNNLNRKPRVR